MKKDWGATFKERTHQAQRAINRIGGEDLIKELDRAGMGNSPAVLKTFYKVADLLGEGTITSGKASGLLSPGDAQAKINEVMNDPKHPYFNHGAPGHKEAVEQVNKWFGMTG